MPIGIVIPAFEPNANQLLQYIQAIDERLSPARIIVELDSPLPGTSEVLSESVATIHTADHRRGKGAAITAGFEALETETLVFCDADGSTPAHSLARIIEPVRGGECDISIGSRRHPDAQVTAHQTHGRRLLGFVFAQLAKTVTETDLYDYQCGAKALSANAWQMIRSHLYQPGFSWDIELLAIASALGERIREVPIEWVDKPGSTVAPIRDSLRMLWGLLLAQHQVQLLKGRKLHTLLDVRRTSHPLVSIY
jgi:glycosyltransferase involved in cell wall biosynthesis